MNITCARLIARPKAAGGVYVEELSQGWRGEIKEGLE